MLPARSPSGLCRGSALGGGRSERPDPFRLRIAQFRSARPPLRSGLAESHGGTAIAGRWPAFARRLILSPRSAPDGSLGLVWPASAGPRIRPWFAAVDDGAHHPAFGLTPDFAGRTTRINPASDRRYARQRGAAKEASVIASDVRGPAGGPYPNRGDVWVEMGRTDPRTWLDKAKWGRNRVWA